MTADIIENSMKIEQITEDNKFVKLWDSLEDIEDKLDYDIKCIINCCNGIVETYNSFIWKYTVSNASSSDSEWRCIGEVNGYDFSNYFISESNCRIRNKKQKEITIRNGKVNLIDAEKKKHVLLIDSLTTTPEDKTYKKYVKKIDKKTGKELKMYESVEEAYKELGKPVSASVARVCDKLQKSAFGYRWSWCVIPTINDTQSPSTKKCGNCEKGNAVYEDECERCILNRHYYTIYREFEKQQDPSEKFVCNTRIHKKICHFRGENPCINEELKDIKNEARVEGISFEIPDSVCKDIMKIRCFYCGFLSYNGSIPSSITRKDNSKAYTVENIVPCCKMCSSSKNSLDSDVFITRMIHISKIFFDVGEEDPQVWSDSFAITFQEYKERALIQSSDWDLTEETFDKICSLPCHYCLKSPLDVNGIGRFLNNIGYIKENCISCCSKCNVLRSDLSYGDFLNLAWSVAVNNKHKNILRK